MTTARFLALCGASAVAVYVVTTASGSVIDPAYSQMRQHVSDLTASGAPTRDRLVAPYLLYNALVALFALALYAESARGWLFRIGLGALLLNAFAGVMTVSVFPEDLGGAPVTAQGAGHVAFAGVAVVCTITSALILGVAFRRASRMLSTVSFAIGGGIVASGAVAVAATASRSDLAGLAERVPIGLFLAWVLAVSVFAARFAPPADAHAPSPSAALAARS